jgi:hypothetical protein
MAFTKQSITLTNPAGSGYAVAIGPETFFFDRQEIRAIWSGRRDFVFLLYQMVIVLQQAGIDPNTATLSQIKTTLEAQTYWWGNS